MRNMKENPKDYVCGNMHVVNLMPSHFIQLANLNTTFSLSPPTECRHSVQSLPDLSGKDGTRCRWSDGGHKGPTVKEGRGVGVGSHGRSHPAQTLHQAHERHREVTKSHPGAGGHREVICEGETTTLGLLSHWISSQKPT